MMTTRDKVAAYHQQGKGTLEISNILGINKASVSYHKSMLGVSEKQASPVNWDDIANDIANNLKRNDILKKHGIGANRFNAAIANGLLPSRALSKFDPLLGLIENSTSERKTVKRYLINEGLLTLQCAICAQGPVWNNKPLSFALDHKNGIPNDNRIDNLRLLCPNCHSQTETFAGKNNKGRKNKIT